jgi:hypothetical protein
MVLAEDTLLFSPAFGFESSRILERLERAMNCLIRAARAQLSSM